MKELIKKLQKYEIRIRKAINDQMQGDFHSVFKGTGLEFDDVRAYQYGDDGRVVMKEGSMRYTKGENKYIELGRDQEPEFDSKDKQLFPRIWDRSNDQGHATFYADWLGLERSQNPQTGEEGYEAPTYADNINWFFTYQMAHMYWRYFMWNFAGKQNDIQGFGSKRDGNWKTGFSFIDNSRLGDQDKMPESLKKNKANITFTYCLLY